MSRATLTDDEARALGERYNRHASARARMLGWMGDEQVAVVEDDVPGSDANNDPPRMLLVYQHRHRRLATVAPEWVIPDLRDAATRGAALEVVRERWGRPIFLMPDDASCRSWGAYTPGVEPEQVAEGASEEEALVAALEACPKAPTRA